MTDNMHKYLLLIQKSIQKRIEYRSEILVWMMLDIIPMLLLLIIWSGIYAGRDTLRGYTLSQLVQYYTLGIMIEGITSSHFESKWVAEIRLGKIDYFLTRPLPYLYQLFLDHLASKIFYLGLALPVYLLLWSIINALIKLPNLAIGPSALFFFSLTMVVAFLIQFFLALITVLLGFWFEGADGLQTFKDLFISLLSGIVIPLSMMPPFLQSLTLNLPLKYLYTVPIGLVQHTYQPSCFDSLFMALSVATLWLTTFGLWQLAKRKYTSAGG